MNGMALLTTNDMFRSIVMSAILRRAEELRKDEREHLASTITNRIVEAWNKGQKG